MTFETNTYSYFTDSNQSHCDMEYNIPDFNSYAFGSPTYSSSSSSNHSAMGSSVLEDDRRVSRELTFNTYEFSNRDTPLLTPPPGRSAKTFLPESSPYYSLPPLTCYSSNCEIARNQKCQRPKALKYQKVLTGAPRRYQCTVCVKRFTRPSSLATHMHSHTGEKPYQCEVEGCGRRFSVVSNLRRHSKIHLQSS